MNIVPAVPYVRGIMRLGKVKLRLRLLTPDMVEAVLHGKQRPELTLARVMKSFTTEWDKQRMCFGEIDLSRLS